MNAEVDWIKGEGQDVEALYSTGGSMSLDRLHRRDLFSSFSAEVLPTKEPFCVQHSRVCVYVYVRLGWVFRVK